MVRHEVGIFSSFSGCFLFCSFVTSARTAAHNLAQFVSNPGKVHWRALKHLFRFLRGTEFLSLVYNRFENHEFFGFSESDWATDQDDRKPTSGFCFKLSRFGSVVPWASKKQGRVALSSCEAEYI